MFTDHHGGSVIIRFLSGSSNSFVTKFHFEHLKRLIGFTHVLRFLLTLPREDRPIKLVRTSLFEWKIDETHFLEQVDSFQSKPSSWTFQWSQFVFPGCNETQKANNFCLSDILDDHLRRPQNKMEIFKLIKQKVDIKERFMFNLRFVPSRETEATPMRPLGPRHHTATPRMSSWACHRPPHICSTSCTMRESRSHPTSPTRSSRRCRTLCRHSHGSILTLSPHSC